MFLRMTSGQLTLISISVASIATVIVKILCNIFTFLPKQNYDCLP